MSDVQRICPECGGGSPMHAQHCPDCGYDSQSGLPMQRTNTLPVTLSKAALPVLAGAAGLALRAGWRLLQGRMTTAIAQQTADQAIQVPPATRQPDEIQARRPRRTVRIRSTWAVGDARGAWQQGSSEHVIEFDD